MTEVAPPANEGLEPARERRPDRPTGAHDPFDPVVPDDPYQLAAERDPLAPEDPDPDPTMTGGVEIPPPAGPPPGAQPPQAHAKLATAAASLGPLPDPTDFEQKTRVRAWRKAQEVRYSLSDAWSMMQRLTLVTSEVVAANAKDPVKEQAKLAQLRQDLDAYGNLAGPLDAWCAARDATPVALAALADAAKRLRGMIDPLLPLLRSGSLGPGIDLQRQTLGEGLAGIVAEVTSEARQALAGERVSRGRPSDVIANSLARSTRDQVWASRLETCSTWQDAGKMAANAIGAAALDVPVSKSTGKLNLSPMTARLAGLDRAAKARASVSGKADYGTRSDVLRAYTALGAELGSLIATVRNRQAELAKASGSAGWDAVQARSAADVLAGLARAVRGQLAADPLLQDPDLASGARAALDQIGKVAGQTSLEALVDNAGSDLRKSFDQGLGPLLDRWAAGIEKFPRHDRADLKQVAAAIAEQLQRYRAEINQRLGAQRSSGLVEGLDVVAAAMTRQVRSFDSRGGLFA